MKNWKEHDPDYAGEKEKHANPLPSRRFLSKTLTAHAGPLTAAELGVLLGLTPEEAAEGLDKRLQAMVRDGQLVQNRRGAYGTLPRMNARRGGPDMVLRS